MIDGRITHEVFKEMVRQSIRKEFEGLTLDEKVNLLIEKYIKIAVK